MAGLKQHLVTVVIVVAVAALGAGGSIFLLGSSAGKAQADAHTSASTAAVHDQKIAKRGKVTPQAQAPTATVEKVVPVTRATSEQPALATVQAASFYEAARRIVADHWGGQALDQSHVALSVACQRSYAVVVWSAPTRLTSIEIWLHGAGSSWQAVSAQYTHYSATGKAVSSDRLPGSSKPAGVTCFQ